jgi:LPXTG-site transpeptidase (sortase) family protein
LKPDDTQITVDSVSYDPATYLAKLTVNDGAALPNGIYRLFICGTTSIIDATSTTYLNNHTDDSRVTFTVAIASSSGSGSSHSSKSKKLPATGFAPDLITLLPEQPIEKAYAAEGMWLEIPALGLKQSIVGVPGPDWDVTWLGNQIGYLQGTAFPTWNGNSVLTGHVTDANGKPGPFASLGSLAWGNQIIIYAWGQAYIYEVRSVNLWTDPNSTSALTRHEDLPWLTLITCHGYDEKTDTYRWRTIVRAVLVSVK